MSEKIRLTASKLCKVSGLSLEQWGIDETTSVVVSETFVNGYTADGIDIPDLCAGNHALQRKVWAEVSARWGSEDQTYRIAFVSADGSFDVVEQFDASDDEAANSYAAQHYGDKEWFVLNADGNNING
jgi:hypothetical protein